MPPGSAPGSGTTGLEAVPVGEDRGGAGEGGREGTSEIKQHLQEHNNVAQLAISIIHNFIFTQTLLNHPGPLRQ